MSTHNIGFYEEISKNIPELSSNMHLISSSGNVLKRRKKSVSQNHRKPNTKRIDKVLRNHIFF